MFAIEEKGSNFHCAFYAGKHFIEGLTKHVSLSGIALELDNAPNAHLSEGSRGECFIDGKVGLQSTSCGFNCEVVAAGDKNIILRFNPLNDTQIKFIRTLNTISA